MSNQTIKYIVPVAVLLILWFIPAPEGLSANAWHFLAVFFAVVVGLIIEPVPAALVGFTGISLVALLGLVGNPKESITWALSGFSNSVIWLIFAAFMFALGYKKTGLGKRVSLIMIKYMGKSSLGLGYAVAFSDLVLAPFMPSNTARSAGSVYPVAINIPHIFDSYPDKDPRKLGAYISWVAIATTCITSSMFLTALAPNLLAVDLIGKSTGHVISWGEWAGVMLPLMIPLFLLTPWLTYVVYPPTQKKSPEAPAWAAEELKKLGAITFKEYLMAGLATVALVLWIFGKEIGVDSTTVAISVVSIMVLTNVITWDDLISNKAAFNVLIWFASLVAMAAGLKKVGILDWIGANTQEMLAGMSPIALILSLLVLFFLLHYFFASVTAHVTALVPIFMTIAASLLAPEQLVPFTVILAGSLGVMGIITPYATGPSPIWYGAGYISQARWWGLGAIFGALYLAVIILGAFIFI
ncbi:MAG: DASS family sodium-coupled anion symporter [Arcobacter sp.]|jgi:L-tartrate/succinate antiporter|uniref:Sodium:sulfate symporter family protein n=1 Tax=Arcobacter defluvii TaxID=873191 RepID=A0AAE7E861_9BACT|nr:MULTISPECIES: DASS family sodium-coupled anion symporter [Arcobacter]MDY3200142.1 DASS family sodium-coupled anion symporter [Arcobacter sp.]QKF78754.1 sodium:sulfate symporter family protein [Arcobacter defluvii]RXI33936.1 anion permease [Arcobacter defluvii]BAK74528.1 sodium-sulfate symporter [Arcobacter sp. L]